MRHRTTFVLLILFLTGLGVLWWADYADVPTRDQKSRMLNRLLPELIDTTVTDIRRIEVDRGSARTGRRSSSSAGTAASGRCSKPVDAAADTNLVETLVREPQGLAEVGRRGHDPRRPRDLRPRHSRSDRQGLRCRRVQARSRPSTLARASRIGVYVRPAPKPGIEVVDKRLLAALGTGGEVA